MILNEAKSSAALRKRWANLAGYEFPYGVHCYCPVDHSYVPLITDHRLPEDQRWQDAGGRNWIAEQDRDEWLGSRVVGYLPMGVIAYRDFERSQEVER